MQACDNGNGEAVFNLSQADATINGNTGLEVLYYEDVDAQTPIIPDNAFLSGSAIVYAAIDNGVCLSPTVPVDLSVLQGPDVMLTATANVSCAGAADGALLLDIMGDAPFTIDWNIDALDGNLAPANLSSGLYEVTVTDVNDCSTNTAFNLAEPTDLTLDCQANTTGQGAGPGSYTFVFNGGTPDYFLSLSGPLNLTFTESTAGFWESAVLPQGSYTFTLMDANGCEEICTFDIPATPCTLSFQQTGTTPSCHDSADGDLTVIPANGTPPYQYDWSLDAFDGLPTVTGLNPGDAFSITITDDAGCTQIGNFLIPGPAALVVDCGNTSDPSANGSLDGSTVISVNQGTPPYNILWTGPQTGSGTMDEAGSFLATGLSAGNYTVTVTDQNGCQETCTFTLNQPGCNLIFSLLSSPPFCFGEDTGLLEVSVPPSENVTSIDWNVDAYDGLTLINNVPPGFYEVTVTVAGGCSSTLSVTLTYPPALVVDCSNTTQPTANNNDGSVGLVVSGATAPYTITWAGPQTGSGTLNEAGSFSATGLQAGEYTVTVTDFLGCTQTCTFTLVVVTCSFDVTELVVNETCAGAQDGAIIISTTGGQPPYIFAWNNMETSSSINNLAAGNYSYTVTDSNSCTAAGQATVAPGAPLPTLVSTGDGTICAGSCYTLPVSLTGQSPFSITYSISAGGATTLYQQVVVATDTTLTLCPADLNLSPGNLQLQFTQIADANCSATLAAIHSFEYLAPAYTDITETLCEGDSLFIGNTVFHQDNPTGQVILSGQGAGGCDSIVDVTLNFLIPGESLVEGLICPSDTFFVAGQAFFEGNTLGTIVLDNAAANGCDSIIYVVVTLQTPSSHVLTPTICQGDTLTIAGQSFYEGFLSDTLVLNDAAANGCDSILFVQATLLPAPIATLTPQICAGDTLSIAGQLFHQGFLMDTLVLEGAAANGCDSILMVQGTY
ncbi:MAG: SprB repeat-containing protein [Saprospiraceae bacterium]